MSKIRAQVITRRADALAIDHIVNTIYFDDFNVAGVNGTDWAQMALDIRGAFAPRGGVPTGYGVEVKLYDMADALPRPIKATAPWTGYTNAALAGLPREVALCLSYFSERNLPRFRGRLYIGPWNSGTERPDAGQISVLTALAGRLQTIGGVDTDWGLWSTTRNDFSKITAGWVDNEWDTTRSRGLRAVTRTTYVTNE
jgi:hypothetical protein